MKLRDVARAAGVSPATASRVLNNDPAVGADYRRRVNAAASELGYRPNSLARNLRSQRTTAIGVVVPDIENPHFAEMVRAVEEQAFASGYRVHVCNTNESPEKQRAYLEALVDERVLGVILSPSDPNGSEIGAVIDAGIPVVAFDREVSDPRADVVIGDNIRGTRAATTLLIDAGHREIVFVGGRSDVETGAERLDGFELSMRAEGLEPRSIDGGFRIEGGYRAVAELLASPSVPSALVIGNNLMTIGALRALREAGRKVPDEIALVAIDDPFWAAFLDPPLTTVAQPVRRMATDAMQLLAERVSGLRTEPRRSVHPFELRRRISCGTA